MVNGRRFVRAILCRCRGRCDNGAHGEQQTRKRGVRAWHDGLPTVNTESLAKNAGVNRHGGEVIPKGVKCHRPWRKEPITPLQSTTERGIYRALTGGSSSDIPHREQHRKAR
jgi:hypothetical protein